MENVESLADISGNPSFVETMLLRQQSVRIAKCAPIFHDWYFDAELEFDTAIIDKSTLVALLQYGATYGGFGDFRPTFGRARFEEI